MAMPLDAFTQNLLAGYQIGQQGLEREQRRQLLEQQQETADMGTLGDLLKLAPGETKNQLVNLLAERFKKRGTPLPATFWGSFKKDDEGYQQELQTFMDYAKDAGLPLGARTLGQLFQKPEALVNLYKQFQESKQDTLIQDALRGAGAPTIAAPPAAPAVTPDLPMAQGQMYGPTQYRAAVEAAAQQHGLDPALVAAVAQVESGWNPRAVSPKGAQGLMQFMPATAREQGLTDPFNAEQSLERGAGYLKQLIDAFGGDVQKGLMAYNWGIGNLQRALAAGQEIPGQVQGYGQRIMALAKGYGWGGTAEAATPTAARPIAAASAQLTHADAEIADLERKITALMPLTSERANKIRDDLQRRLDSKIRQRESLLKRTTPDLGQDVKDILGGQGLTPETASPQDIAAARAQAFRDRQQLQAAQGTEAATIQVEKEQTKPLAEDANKFMHVESLQHPKLSQSRRDVAQSGEYVPMEPGEQQKVREKVASLSTLQNALVKVKEVVEQNPELFPEGAQGGTAALVELGLAKLKSATGKLSPEHRKALATLQAVQTARARFARAWGDVGALTELEQRLQTEAIAPGADFRDSVLERLAAMEELLLGPSNEYFRGLGLRVQVPMKLQRPEISDTAPPIQVAPGITIQEIK